MEEFSVTGTYIWYYYICKREIWLLSHSLEADQGNDNIVLGNFIHENSYKRDKKELSFGDNKFDIIYTKKGELIVGEIKKSSRYLKSAKMQLAFYLKQLKEAGIDAKGQILFPEERKKETIILDEQLFEELKRVEDEIIKIVNLKSVPMPIKSSFCKNCAYGEFCWA